MKQTIEFYKIEATGNDFIVFSEPEAEVLLKRPSFIQRICERHRGVGADGVILVRRREGTIRMNYYNKDGSEASMCGNGLRAAALMSVIQGFSRKNETFKILAPDGAHEVVVIDENFARVELLVDHKTRPRKLDITELPDYFKVLGFINTGVPHLVIEVPRELTDLQITEWGRRLRYDASFSPEGTNVNFLRRISEYEIEVRTYERGVEEETLSCGTGVVASALLYQGDKNEDARFLQIFTKGGKLKVIRENGKIYLEGPARYVFEGKVPIA